MVGWLVVMASWLGVKTDWWPWLVNGHSSLIGWLVGWLVGCLGWLIVLVGW